MELKARFDEERNIIGARELQDAGVQVLHGIRGFKTHSKICLIVRRDSDGIRRYMHFSTGNYNEITARIYSDVSYFTCAPEYGQDASAFFNAITGYSTLRQFHKLDMSPVGIRTRLLDMINGEISRHQAGRRASFMSRSIPYHKDMIDALYRAAKAGVRVMLNVRGICCLRPGVPGLSDNISVVSIVDRFLEHARILYFHRGGKPQVFISSADWMTRNLDRRVELLVPIADDDARKRLISMLEIYCSTQQHKGRVLNADGNWKCHVSNPTAKTPSTQDAFCAEAQEDEQLLEQNRRTVFDASTTRKQTKKGWDDMRCNRSVYPPALRWTISGNPRPRRPKPFDLEFRHLRTCFIRMIKRMHACLCWRVGRACSPIWAPGASNLLSIPRVGALEGRHQRSPGQSPGVWGAIKTMPCKGLSIMGSRWPPDARHTLR